MDLRNKILVNCFCSRWMVFTCCFFFLLSLSSCEKDKERLQELSEEPRELPRELGEEVEILYTDFGEPRIKILASEVSRNDGKDPFIEFPAGLRVYFYNSEQQIDSRLSANYGIVYEQKEEMLVQDNVVMVNVYGEKLNTEELLWKQKQKKIITDKFVKITTAEEIIMGEGLEAKEDFTEYTIKKIKGTIRVDADNMDEDL